MGGDHSFSVSLQLHVVMIEYAHNDEFSWTVNEDLRDAAASRVVFFLLRTGSYYRGRGASWCCGG